eukprot:2496894-Karenia_brevis.AAC.1
MRECAGPDFDIVQKSHLAYHKAGLERASEKAFGASKSEDQNLKHFDGTGPFVAWGTEVDSDTGTVGTPRNKRAQLAACGAA